MPRTRAILFSFHTFLHTLHEVRSQGLGPELADAIEGLGAGNAPEMRVYKGSVYWGRSVTEFLRAEGTWKHEDDGQDKVGGHST